MYVNSKQNHPNHPKSFIFSKSLCIYIYILVDMINYDNLLTGVDGDFYVFPQIMSKISSRKSKQIT